MKIIKAGDKNLLKQIIRFTCPKCLCVFEAEKGEWEYAPQMQQQRGEGTYRVVCPCCKNIVYV